MAVTTSDFRRRYATGVLSEPRIEQALGSALYAVRRRHGPDNPGVGKLLRVTWDIGIHQSGIRILSLGRNMAAIRSVKMGDGTSLVAPESYRLVNNILLEQEYFDWYGLVVADCVADDDQSQRDAMTAELAAARLGIGDKGDKDEQVLSRISRAGVIKRLPTKIEEVDDD